MGFTMRITCWAGPADMPMILGQTAGRSVQILQWAGILIAAVVVLIVAALILRKLLLGNDRGDAMPGFTLGDLRRLHQTGQLTDAEYAAAKESMVARSTAMFDAKPGRRTGSTRSSRGDDLGARPTTDGPNDAGESDEASDNRGDPDDPPPVT